MSPGRCACFSAARTSWRYHAARTTKSQWVRCNGAWLLALRAGAAAVWQPTTNLVGLCAKGIQVVADGTSHQDGILWNDADVAAQSVQPNLGNIHSVDQDPTACRLDQPEHKRHERAFASSSATHNANFPASLDYERYVFQHFWLARFVAKTRVFEDDFPRIRPPGSWFSPVPAMGVAALLRHLEILQKALETGDAACATSSSQSGPQPWEAVAYGRNPLDLSMA